MRSLCPEFDRVKTGLSDKIKDFLAGIFMKKHAGNREMNHDPI